MSTRLDAGPVDAPEVGVVGGGGGRGEHDGQRWRRGKGPVSSDGGVLDGRAVSPGRDGDGGGHRPFLPDAVVVAPPRSVSRVSALTFPPGRIMLAVLRYRLTHPSLLRALGSAGHNSKVLLADGNYPHATGIHSQCELIYLNLRPGLVGVLDVLEVLLDACPFERAAVMRPDEGGSSPMAGAFRELLGEAVPLDPLDRRDFYAACRNDDVAVAVATGERRHYANILLTVGSLPPETQTAL